MKARFANALSKIKAINYRHYICVGITLLFLGLGFLFPNAIPRLCEAIRDLGISCAYYFMGLISESGEVSIHATVTDMPSWIWAESPFGTLSFMPENFDAFAVKWGAYWERFISQENLVAYGEAFGDFFFYLSRILLILMPFALVLVMYCKRYLQEIKDAVLDRCLELLEENLNTDCSFSEAFRATYETIMTELKESDKYTEAKMMQIFDTAYKELPEGETFDLEKVLCVFKAVFIRVMYEGKDSKPLQIWKRFVFSVCYPVRDFCKSLGRFIVEQPYGKAWLCLWLLYFNLVTVIVAFIAFYLYFIVSFDLIGIYTQVLKLLHDLTPMIKFIPAVIWCVVGFVVLHFINRYLAFQRLYKHEEKNEAFVEGRGVNTIFCGEMGCGKTSAVTSVALTTEVKFRNDSFEILLECDMLFPNFPWCNLRTEIKKAIERKDIVDIWSARRWVRRWREWYDYTKENPKWWERAKRKHSQRYGNFLFNYDEEHYPTTFNDELKIEYIWDTIKDYTEAYLIYTIQTSYIIANYSIRVDDIKEDIGNFPLYNTDFFKRDPRLMDAYSRQCHILDYDMLRLGKRMLEDNPNRNAFGFGIYVISEIDKELKNADTLRDVKASADECNQKNDFTIPLIKMSRHATVIRNRVFVRIYGDLQRPEDLGASARQVGDIVWITKQGDMIPTLPRFTSPFWLFEGVFLWLKGKFDDFYAKYIYARADNTLFVHLMKGTMAVSEHYVKRVNNLFGSQTVHFETESGRMDGERKKCKWYKMPKKDYSKRYSTNCLAAIFDTDEYNRTSLDELRMYADIMATRDELEYQNSHFQNDIRKYRTYQKGEKAA